jgi:hypothetical protein
MTHYSNGHLSYIFSELVGCIGYVTNGTLFPLWCTTFDQGPQGSALFREYDGAIWDAPMSAHEYLPH